MQTKITRIVTILSLLLGLFSCSDDISSPDTPTGGRSPIEMSAGGMDDRGALSRAVITDGSGKTLEAMPAGTEIWTAMMSEYNTSYEGNDWAFPSGARAHMLYCATYGKANAPVDGKAPVDFGSNVRYWDDAHARSSIITIRALAVPGVPIKDGGGAWVWRWKTAESGGEVPLSAWGNDPANAPTTAYWALSTNQTDDTFKKEDLCFSNNLADNRGKGNADARLMFRESPTRKFDAGNMVFYHALTKFTIKIKCGDGFNGDGTDFHFTGSPTGKDNSFALKGFYGKGVFDLAAGEFQSLTAADITTFTSIYLAKTTPQKKEAGDYYTLQAYVLPGTDIKDGDNVADAFSFDIDKNHYKISMLDLYNAILNKKDGMGAWQNSDNGTEVKDDVLGGGKTLLAGVNYQFTFTVEKTKIKDITAQVIDWESVEADNVTPSNARINIMLEERGTAVTAGVNFYRTRDPGNNDVSDDYVGYAWDKGYTTDGKATAAYDSVKGKWTVTRWYWPDNTTYYHFRALGNTTHTSPESLPAPVADVSDGPDYFNLTHGESYEDYIWGAPFLDDADNETAGSFQWSYSLTKGFDGTDAEDGKTPQRHQIYHGIGPTNSVIKILMFHVMSDVTFTVKTTTGENKVTLKDGDNHTKIRLENLYTSGKVLMGNGLVTTTGATVDYPFSNAPVADCGGYSWKGYGAVPQSLDDVVLVITTPDNNEYKVAMKDMLATAVSTYNIANPYAKNSSGKYMIDRWYPGFKYSYSFTLTKKGIENITATVIDWEEVKADDDIVQIK